MTPPNVVLITWHDAGRWFGCYGNPNVRTPNVDRLAAEGCRFANTISACAICSPSRAAIATGRYCQDNGVMFLTNTVNNNRLHRGERHVARLLKEEHGYRTALFGVQHECAHEHVTEIMAVDERFSTDPWRDAPVTAAHACRWLRERAGERQPFYMQFGLLEAHMGRYHLERDPSLPTDEEHGLHIPPYLADAPGTRAAVRVLQGLLRRGDEAIGQVLGALREAGLEDNTIVAMCVDHGVGLPRAKTTCYDPGIAVAWLLRYPGRIPGGTVVPAMTAQVDILPTILDLTGLPIPSQVQGMSFAGHAQGQRSDEQRHEAFSHMVETIRSIRTHDFKFIRHFRPARVNPQTRDEIQIAEESAAEGDVARVELYDLRRDPREFHNLADDPAHADRRRTLDGRLWDFLLEHNDFVLNEPANSEWQAETRRQLAAHCATTGHPLPEVDF